MQELINFFNFIPQGSSGYLSKYLQNFILVLDVLLKTVDVCWRSHVEIGWLPYGQIVICSTISLWVTTVLSYLLSPWIQPIWFQCIPSGHVHLYCWGIALIVRRHVNHKEVIRLISHCLFHFSFLEYKIQLTSSLIFPVLAQPNAAYLACMICKFKIELTISLNNFLLIFISGCSKMLDNLHIVWEA